MTVGGAELAAEFMRLGLIDEYRIHVHPVVVGEGKALFKAGLSAELELKESKKFGNGVVMMRYWSAPK
jgi:dihydrofolate reductase